MSSQSPFNGVGIGYADTVNTTGLALSGLDCGNNVRAGTKCYVNATGNYWTLTVSAAAVDHVTVETALNFPAMRWIKDGAVGGGTVTSITSTGATVTVTNPAGPVVNVEVASPAPTPGGAPPAIAAASAAGAAATYSRSDHTHQGVASLASAGGTSVVTGSPGAANVEVNQAVAAPPSIASTSSVGASTSSARGDHTHALDILAYNPSLAGMQATGILQQAYGAPTATPSILNVATGLVPFGNAGVLATSANISYTTATNRLTLVSDNVFGDPQLLLDNPNVGGINQIRFRTNGVGTYSIYALAGPAALYNAIEDAAALASWAITDSGFNASILVLPNERDVGIGKGGIAAGGTKGFLFYPTMSGLPVGAPTHVTAFPSQAGSMYDRTNNRLNFYNAAWFGIPAASPIAAGAGIPVFTTAPAGIVSLNALWETYRDSAGVLSYRAYFQ